MSTENKKHTPLWRVARGLSSVAFGPLLATDFVKQRVLATEISHSARTSQAVNTYKTRFPDKGQDTASQEAPVFIFSAGWGSGSTLLQRLLISSGELVIWGEPVDEAFPIHRLSQMIDPVRGTWPPPDHFREGADPKNLSSEWIANYAPEMPVYKQAHTQFISHWLSNGGQHERWGMKEVRLTIDHAVYLKWLYPNAKFLFIYRDVMASYLSIRRKPWLSVWPNHVATDIVSFAHHWKHLLEGYLDRHVEVEGMLVKFEDLISGEIACESIAEYAGLSSMDASILEQKIGARSTRRKPLILPERIILNSVTGSLRKRVGYQS